MLSHHKTIFEQNISLCLVTYNEAATLYTFFAALKRQSQIAFLKKCLIVDNGSSDDTMSVLLQIKTSFPVPIEIISNPINSIGLARRLSVEHSATDFVLFSDPDCHPHTTWIEELCQYWSQLAPLNPNLAGVGGSNRLPNSGLFQQATNTMLSSFWGHGRSPQGWSPKSPQIVDHLPTTNALFLRDTIVKVGNFSPTFSQVCEDVDLGIRLKNANHELYLIPTFPISNASATNYKNWAQRMKKFGAGQVLLSKIHSKPLRLTSLLSSIFCSGIVLSLLLSLLHWPFALVPITYAIGISLLALWISVKNRQILLWPYLIKSFMITHFFYGWGVCSALIPKNSNIFKSSFSGKSPDLKI